MRQKEQDRLHWLMQVQESEITRRRVAEEVDVSGRWVRELVPRYLRMESGAVAHRLRSRIPNRRNGQEVRQRAAKLPGRSDWHDLGRSLRPSNGPGAAEGRARRLCGSG